MQRDFTADNESVNEKWCQEGYLIHFLYLKRLSYTIVSILICQFIGN